MSVHSYGGDQPAGEHAGDELVWKRGRGRGEHRTRSQHRGHQQRFGQESAPRFLEYDGQHAQAEAEAAAVLRDRQGADIHLVVEQRPQLGGVALRALQRLANLLVGGVCLQEVAHDLAQVLVLGDGCEDGRVGLGPGLGVHSSPQRP